jgi:predicted aspartyl protease
MLKKEIVRLGVPVGWAECLFSVRRLKTVGGASVADVGYATSINVGGAVARGVVVAVLRGTANPLGGRLDGLLGMSFLSRFKVNLSQNGVYLTPIPLR